MKTGICSTDFESYYRPLPTAHTLFSHIRELGFETVQFSFSSISETCFAPTGQHEIPASIPAEAIRRTAEAAAKYDLPLSMINGTFNMAHPDPAIREEGLRRFILLCDAAVELDCPYVSLCSGSRNPDHLWTYSPENSTNEAWDAMFDTISRAVEIAEARGITLGVESEAANVIDTPEKARRLMDSVGSDKLKMILDCANLFHRGEAYPENVRAIIGHAFELYGKDIIIAHGKDIRAGEGIDFCGTGLGIVDFGYVAQMLHEYGFGGNMLLHGIYAPADMPRALSHWLAAKEG